MLKKLSGLLSLAGNHQQDDQERIEVAVAVVLLEMANADHTFARDERQLIEGLLARQFSLSPEAAEELLELAEQVRSNSFDLQQFTSLINQGFSHEEKLAVMETLWRIVYADGVLDKYEDALARQLASLLRLSPREAIDLKVKILDELDPER